jgi:hypothetical protein
LGVSRSGFYDWLRRQHREPDPEREEKLGWVKDIAASSDHTFGSRRMAKALQALGYPVGRHQARGLMRAAGVWVRYRRRYRVTTDSNHRQPVFPNRLERDFVASGPNQPVLPSVPSQPSLTYDIDGFKGDVIRHCRSSFLQCRSCQHKGA